MGFFSPLFFFKKKKLALRGPFCVSDPSKPDNPLVFASKSFLSMFGYDWDEIVGKNCRFLQGKGTNRSEVEKIRALIQKQESGVVNVLNYTKKVCWRGFVLVFAVEIWFEKGDEIMNMFMLVPLKLASGETALFFGGQCESNQAPITSVVGVGVSNLVYRVPGGPPVVPNVSAEGAIFKNEFAKGKILIKTRTNPLAPSVAPYFQSRNRMFEYQVQFELLQPIPDDHEIFIGAGEPG